MSIFCHTLLASTLAAALYVLTFSSLAIAQPLPTSGITTLELKNRADSEHECESNKLKQHSATGTFCITKKNPGKRHTSKLLARALLDNLFNGKSVVDLGGGQGGYAREWLALSAVNPQSGPRDVRVFDGATHIEEVTGGFVKWADLSQPLDVPPADWAMSLEVAEHIPKRFEDAFIENIHRLNTHGVVISWAVKGQTGIGHVNCQNADYVIPRFTALGYHYDGGLSVRFRGIARRELDWFGRTIYVFRRGSPLPSTASATSAS